MKELPKTYEPNAYEKKLYQLWEESGFFRPEAGQPLADTPEAGREPYTIMMPPPNVTGVLHLGHALENTLMDIMARYQRMRGKRVLLLPGTDHAAVATQAKVEKMLVEGGIAHPREALGREGLLEKIRTYAENSKATILSQIRSMGTSCDWSRLAYTFDEARNRAVNEMFVRMYNDGLIYRGHRVVNWSVKGQSTCSDDELVYVERQAKLYTFRYSRDFPIPISSTRPETKLGDTAVAVHPTDERYTQYIGQTFSVDVGAKESLQIKIIADPQVDKDFGTGALGVTPAHSAIDFEMYERQKAAGDPIGLVQVIGADGTMTAAAGKAYEGLPVEEARGKFVAWLKDNGLLMKEEEIVQNVGTSDRFKDVVEAIPMTQWFVAVNKGIPGRGKTLKDLMREAVATGHNGDPHEKVRITPERFEKIYYHWIEHLRDWCISRQIWWGHRIPVWYRGEDIFCGVEAPKEEGWIQDEDTLDTWFSSGTWTFSTLGWPEKTADLKTFHPTSWMQMGHEILFFWMARMILFSTYALDQIPFRDVYIHGLLRNEQGKKFSKSDGNTLDPLTIIGEYGTDALRYSIVAGIAPGNDARFYREKIEGARNLVTKLWNMSRFMLMQIGQPSQDAERPSGITLADQWILSRLDEVTREMTNDLEKFAFSQVGERLRDFTWSDLADWYLEIAKIEGDKSAILNFILNRLLVLWHPYMPFVTEAIWQEMYGRDRLLMSERWPETADRTGDLVAFETIKNIITAIRSLRADHGVDPGKRVRVTIVSDKDQALFDANAHLFRGLARIESLTITGDESEKPPQSAVAVLGGVKIYLHLDTVDAQKEMARFEKEIAKVRPFVETLRQKLENPGFVDRAPEAVVAAERKKLAEAEETLTKLMHDKDALS